MITKYNERKSLSITITFVMILLVSGCYFPDVYKTKVYQGNQFEQGNVSQLKIGMTKEIEVLVTNVNDIEPVINTSSMICLLYTSPSPRDS